MHKYYTEQNGANFAAAYFTAMEDVCVCVCVFVWVRARVDGGEG